MKIRALISTVCFLLLSSASIVYASDSIKALLFPVKFEFNNQSKELDQGHVALNYNGHTYVPARFVAENLGAKVGYDAENKKVVFNHTNVFHAKKVGIGDTIAGMRVLAPDLSEADDEVVGTVHFSGSALITGTYFYSKFDERVGEVLIFNLDEDSANKLPVMSHDNRDQWLVFSNPSDVKELFGINHDNDVSTGKAAVKIKNFVINYQHKDVYNYAQLEEVYLYSGKSHD